MKVRVLVSGVVLNDSLNLPTLLQLFLITILGDQMNDIEQQMLFALAIFRDRLEAIKVQN